MNDAWAAFQKPAARDRFGRYLIPDPKTGKQTAWTRVTTLAKTLDDNHALEKWKLRTATAGLIARPDLYALAHSQLEHNRDLDRTLQDALEAGQASARANTGTALHALTEQHDRGQTPLIPPGLEADLDAYTRTIQAAGISIDQDRIEQILCITGQTEPVAGTVDRVVQMPDGRTLIADLKTGRSLDYAWGAIAIQLACYAHATHTWDPNTTKHGRPAKVDQEQALVIHLPAGEARCELHLIDIHAGWNAAQVALTVRAWRRNKNLNIPVNLGTETPATAAAHDLIKHRARQIIDQGHGTELAQNWPAGIPTFKNIGRTYTIGELTQIEIVIRNIEHVHELPF